MSRDEKIQWMKDWCHKQQLLLALEGECGFGRECVGVSTGDCYPDYAWYDDNFERLDKNGDVWTPANAYHKHDCVAVLGRGEQAEDKLFQWLQWFEANNFKFESGVNPSAYSDPIMMILGRHKTARMVKQS